MNRGLNIGKGLLLCTLRGFVGMFRVQVGIGENQMETKNQQLNSA